MALVAGGSARLGSTRLGAVDSVLVMNLGLDSNPPLLNNSFPKFRFIFPENWIFPIPVAIWRVGAKQTHIESRMRCKF